ncbi:toxin-antitoxin system toxin subunit [Streptomyces sp. CNQ-509]|uniref:DUF397 domain-containing protein n=1 Tax=unclassified Streptomyces TaxID=2593676 RepID=UPI00062E03D4|nr:DUF397 domain-containing protein [Streptomyces sp. CNQ-509]AKH83611.1 toxin-antitoxin system toxin subunit [Streptomyces sp. CNQ-509]
MSTTPDLSRAEWVKSSFSGNGGGSCVEWAPAYVTSGVVPVRDSKDPHGPALTFEPSAWMSFITAVRRNEFGTEDRDPTA